MVRSRFLPAATERMPRMLISSFLRVVSSCRPARTGAGALCLRLQVPHGEEDRTVDGGILKTSVNSDT